MKVWHRISLDPDKVRILQGLNIPYEQGYDPFVKRVKFVAFNIAESHPGWPEIKGLVSREPTFDFVWTEYTQDEIVNAEWLTAQASYSIGRPVPEGESWSKQYYERGCSSCGVTWRQIAPFRINAEPKLRKNVFASFDGAFELFCSTKVLEVFMAEEMLGYDVRPVLVDKAGEASQSLKQLIVPNVAEPALVEERAETERFGKEVCATHGHV